VSAHDDARDVDGWLKIILLDLPESALSARMALSSLQMLALRRALECEELQARLDGRTPCPVLTLVNGGVR
jgi:hypothetical protein